MDRKPLKVGDRFAMIEDGLAGFVTEIFNNWQGVQASAVIKLDDGRWANVDLTDIELIRVRVH